MKKHIEFLGIAYIVYNVLTILTILIVMIILFGLGVFVDQAQFRYHHPWHGPGGIEIILVIVFSILALFLFLSIPGIIAGIGLLKKSSWSRVLTLILGCFNLLNIPFGTALGVYTIWVLLQEETISILSGKEVIQKKT